MNPTLITYHQAIRMAVEALTSIGNIPLPTILDGGTVDNPSGYLFGSADLGVNYADVILVRQARAYRWGDPTVYSIPNPTNPEHNKDLVRIKEDIVESQFASLLLVCRKILWLLTRHYGSAENIPPEPTPIVTLQDTYTLTRSHFVTIWETCIALITAESCSNMIHEYEARSRPKPEAITQTDKPIGGRGRPVKKALTSYERFNNLLAYLKEHKILPAGVGEQKLVTLYDAHKLDWLDWRQTKERTADDDAAVIGALNGWSLALAKRFVEAVDTHLDSLITGSQTTRPKAKPATKGGK